MQKLSLYLPKQTVNTQLSFTLLFFTLLAATLCTPVLHANINNIKGTYDILNPEYKHFSAIHGAVAWETGTIRRMYDLGGLGKKTGQIESKTVQLVHQIFYRIPESTSVTDFVVAEKINGLTDIDVTSFIADCMVYLHNLPETESFKNYQKHFAEYMTKDDSKKPSFKKKFLIPERLIIETSIKKDPIFTKYDATLNNLLPFIINAALECSVENYLPAYTPQLILLGLLYKKTKCSRDMLTLYYQHLQESFDCLNVPADWNGWKKDVFTMQDDFNIAAELQAAPPTDDTIHELYERYIFATLTPDNHPPLISYAKPGIDPTIDCKKESADYRCFADCMDTTIRNFINFLCYNSQTKLFDVTLLENRLGTTVNTSLKDFYTKNPDPNKAGNDPAHNDWAQTVISNIPFVFYRRMLPKPMSQSDDPKFIKVKTSTPKLIEFLNNHQFTIAADNVTTYEIVTSLKNLIIALNHLLGFNLFGEKLAQDFTNEHFIETYLPKLIAAFKTTLPDSFVLKDIDAKDYTNEQIQLPLNLEFEQPESYSIKLTIGTRFGHGEIVFTTDQEKASITPQLLTLNKAPISYILTMGNPTIFPDRQTCLLWLFSQPIDNPDFANDILKENILLNRNILELFLFVAGKNTDDDRKTGVLLKIYKAALEKGLAEDKSVVREAVKIAKKGIKSTNENIQSLGSTLFKALFEKNKAFDEATEAAQDAMKSTDSSTYSVGLNLFKALVEKDKAFDEATKAAQDATKSTNSYIYLLGLTLFIALVEKDKAFDEAAKPAQDAMNSSDYLILSSGSSLFEALLKSNEAFDEATEAAQDAIKSTNKNIQSAGLSLFKTLFEKNKAFDEATKTAQDAIKSTNENIQSAGLSLFEALFEKNRAFDEATKTAQKAVKSADSNTLFLGLSLFKALTLRGKAFDQTTRAVQELESSADLSFKLKLHSLLKRLNN